MRTSQLMNLYINRLSDSAAMICGESGKIVSKSCGINVQKEKMSEEDEVEFSDYAIFQQEIPHWDEEDDDEVEMAISTEPQNSVIRVESVRILTVSTGATFQVGANRTMDLESRFKLIREAPSLNSKESTAN